MISQAVLAAYAKPRPDGIHFGQLTVTGISSCAYATYINYHKLDQQKFEGVDTLRMKNGRYQEAEIVDDLKLAGFNLSNTGKDQLTIHVGKSQVTGRPDGLIMVNKKWDLLEIKAMSLGVWTSVKQLGMKAVPYYLTQVQLYMASDELKDRTSRCWFYTKHKDSCRPNDLEVPQDLNYSKPIIEALDEIILGKAVISRPEEPIALCTKCRHNSFCWKEQLVVDMTGLTRKSLREITEQWKQGKHYKDLGETLIEEARAQIIQELGEESKILIDDLKVTKIVQKRTEFDVQKFIDLYGAENLPKVQTVKPVPQVRITQLRDEEFL